MTAPSKPSWYREFPQGDMTEVQKVMAKTAVECGKAARSDFFVANTWANANRANGPTRNPSGLWCEMGFLPGNFGEPQDIAHPTQSIRVEPRPDIAGHFDTVPMKLRIGLDVDRSPGSDHQGEVWDTDGVRSFYGLIDKLSPQAEVANLFGAQLWNQFNLRATSAQTDAYAWSCSFLPWGSAGNLHTWDPAVPLGYGAIRPEHIWDQIFAGIPIPFAFTHSVDRSCSGNAPQAPHAATATVPEVRDIMNDPRCWVAGGWGGSCSPAPRLETMHPYYPVSGQVPDGARLAGVFPTGHIDDVCKTNGYVPGSLAWQAAQALCHHWEFGGEGKGSFQAQTGGAMITPLDSSAGALAGWKWFGFDGKSNPFRGLFADPSMMMYCNQSTSIDVNGNEWLREVAAAHVA